MKEKLLKIIKNKYLIVSAFMIVWMMFFDRYNLFFQVKLSQRIESLQADKAFYFKEINKIKKERVLLVSNPEALETYAREEYWMKKDDEDLYIIVNPEDTEFHQP